jgi:uncharacterized protein YbjT (DUF2867 family)
MKNGTTKINQVLVLGSTGKTGSRVMKRLAARGVDARGASRTTKIKFDWEDDRTWGAALASIDSVYITFQPDLAVPGSVDAISKLTDLAVKAGVKRLVLLSGRGEPEAQLCEEVVKKSGLEWTIVTASWFCQNFSESFLLDPIMAGHVALPAGNIAEPFIDADDIADIVVTALLDEGHDQQSYEVTGPRLLTFSQAIAEISQATGRELKYEEVSIGTYVAMLSSYGVPAEAIALVRYLFTEVLDGRNAHVADGVQRALGRPATDFSEYVRKNVHVWNGTAALTQGLPSGVTAA